MGGGADDVLPHIFNSIPIPQESTLLSILFIFICMLPAPPQPSTQLQDQECDLEKYFSLSPKPGPEL